MNDRANTRLDASVGTASTNDPLRVLMVVSSYPRTADDSASVFLRYLTDHLHGRGLGVYVLAPADKEAETRREGGVTVRRFRYWPWPRQGLAYGSGILSNLKRNPWLWLQVPFFIAAMIIVLLRTTRQLRPHIIHAHWVIPQGFAAVVSKLISRVPVIITVHGGDVFALRNRFLDALKRSWLRSSDAWTTNTVGTASAIDDGSLPPPHVIPMGVAVEHFAAGKRERLRSDVPQDTRIVLFVGRLVDKKGVDDLLRAFALLPAELKAKTRLWIVGSGEQETSLKGLAATLGIMENTTFWGRVPNDQLPDYYAAADLFVGPSVVARSGDTEGQGVVFLEAFAARLCVLSTRTGGIVEVIENGRTGRLVEPRHPSQLVHAMAELLRDDRQRAMLAANAQAHVRQGYDWKQVAAEFECLYRGVLARSSHTSADDHTRSRPNKQRS